MSQTHPKIIVYIKNGEIVSADSNKFNTRVMVIDVDNPSDMYETDVLNILKDNHFDNEKTDIEMCRLLKSSSF